MAAAGSDRNGSRRAASTPAGDARATGAGPRTRGGWTPVGTAASRRAAQSSRSDGRGAQTRRLLIDAARRVFERDGMIDVGVDEIVREAGVARGSFYTYFASKAEIFRVVTAEVAAVVDEALAVRPGDGQLDAVEALRRSNRRYMTAFRENARIYALVEQLAHTDGDIMANVRRRRQQDVRRVAGTIRRWQARAVADPGVDPVPTAAALLSLTKNVCYWLYVGSDAMYDEEQAAVTIHEIWVRAVDLRRRPATTWSNAAH